MRETIPNFLIKLLKFTKFKTSLPFTVDILDDDGKKLITLKRNFTFFRSNVDISPQAGGEMLKKLVLSAAFCVDMVLKER